MPIFSLCKPFFYYFILFLFLFLFLFFVFVKNHYKNIDEMMHVSWKNGAKIGFKYPLSLLFFDR